MVYVIQSCDEHKSYNSMRIRGIFTNETCLRKALIELFKEDEFDFLGGNYLENLKNNTIEDTENFIKNLSIEVLNVYIDYIFISVYNDNKLV